MDDPSSPEPPSDDHRRRTADRDGDPDLRPREEEAVDAATAERLSRGVRRDAHGEYTPDPYPDDDDPGDSTDDVIELHRREADRIERQPDVPRAGE